MLLIDLRKAYDSVPREVWHPLTMLSVIRSLHNGMQAVVRTRNGTTNNISVTNGLRQGHTLASSLFNLYFSAMVASCRSKCPEVGVKVMFKHGRKLVGDHTAKSHLQEVRVTESQFADDVAVYTLRTAFEKATAQFVNTAAEWGLTVSLEKTKGLVVGKCMESSSISPIQLPSGAINIVRLYLGNNISDDGEVTIEVSTRISKASRTFGFLQQSIFRNQHLLIATKREVYKVRSSRSCSMGQRRGPSKSIV